MVGHPETVIRDNRSELGAMHFIRRSGAWRDGARDCSKNVVVLCSKCVNWDQKES
jgi:hypothetical protein